MDPRLREDDDLRVTLFLIQHSELGIDLSHHIYCLVALPRPFKHRYLHKKSYDFAMLKKTLEI